MALPRYSTAEKITAFVVYLVDPEAGFVTGASMTTECVPSPRLYVRLGHNGAPTSLMLFAISPSYFVSLGSPLHPCNLTQQTQPQGKGEKR